MKNLQVILFVLLVLCSQFLADLIVGMFNGLSTPLQDTIFVILSVVLWLGLTKIICKAI